MKPRFVFTGRCSDCGHNDDVTVMLDGERCITCWCKELDRRQGVTYRYFLTFKGMPEKEVDKATWVAAERWAGFNNTMGHPDEPGTAGFGGITVSGRIERIKKAEEAS